MVCVHGDRGHLAPTSGRMILPGEIIVALLRRTRSSVEKQNVRSILCEDMQRRIASQANEVLTLRGSITRTTDDTGNIHWRFPWSVGGEGRRRRRRQLNTAQPEAISHPSTQRLDAIKSTAARTAESVDRWLRGISSGW